MSVINVQVTASRNGLEGERLIRKFIKKVKLRVLITCQHSNDLKN